MSSLIEEMDSMRNFDMPPRRSESKETASSLNAPTRASILRQTSNKDMAGRQSSQSSRMKTASMKSSYSSTKGSSRGPSIPKKKKIKKHKTHGQCPFELMSQFLMLVSSNKMNEAFPIADEILKYEPDNDLIIMYKESMNELLIQEEKEKQAEAKAMADGEGSNEEESDASESESESDEDSQVEEVEYEYEEAGNMKMDSKDIESRFTAIESKEEYNKIVHERAMRLGEGKENLSDSNSSAKESSSRSGLSSLRKYTERAEAKDTVEHAGLQDYK